MADTVEGVEVRIGADTAQAKSGMDDAASSIASSLASINAALQNFGSRNKAAMDAAVQNNANLSRSFLELKGSATGGLNAIAGVIERFRGVLGTLAAALAGGALFKGSVDAMLRMEDAVRGLEIVFGLSAQKATEMAVQLRLAGVEATTFEQMAMRVGMRLRVNSAEFDTLKIATRDSNGALLPMDQILRNIYTRMQDFKSGADQDLFALTAVGRNARDFAGDMQRMEVATGRTAEVMKRLGIEMGPDRQSQIEAYRMQVNEFKLTIETIGEKLGESLLPRLQGLAEWFNSYGPSAVKVMTFAINSFITVMTYLGTLIGNMVVFAVSRFQNMATAAVAAWQVVKAAATGNFGAIPGIIATANAKIVANTQAATDTIVNQWSDAKKKVDAAWAGNAAPTGLPSAIQKSGKERIPDLSKGDDSLAGLENELKAEQSAYNNRMLQQGSFEVWSETQTRDYWEEVLTMTNLSVKQRMEAENKYYDAERKVQTDAFNAMIAAIKAQEGALKNDANAKIQIAEAVYQLEVSRYGATSIQAQEAYKQILEARQKLADQVKKLAEIQAKTEIELAKLQIDGERQNLAQMVALRQISAQQEYAAEEQLEDRLYQLELDGLNKRRAAAEGDVVMQAEIDAQEEVLFQQHQNKLSAIALAAEKERQQYALQADQAIESSLGTLIDNLVSRTKTLKQSWQDFVTQLTSSLNKIATNEAMQQLLGPGTQGGSFLSGITSKIFGTGGASQAATEAANTTALTALTAALTANTAALTASSASGLGGLFGGGGGSSFGATQGGGIMSLFSGPGLGSLLSLDTGTNYVPQTSLALVHRGEAVIPARYNNQSGKSLTNHNHFYIAGGVDTRTQHQIAKATAYGVRKAQIRTNGS